MPEKEQSKSKGLAGNMMLVSANILLSRIFGFLRDVVFAQIWGTSAAMKAFVLAFKVPNLFRALFGEGALTAAFIPSFTRLHEKDSQSSFKFASRLLSFTATALVVISVLLIFATLFVRLFLDDPTNQLTASLLTWSLLFIPLICLTALGSGMLNTLDSFFLPAFLPTLLNIILIVSALYICPLFGESKNEQIYGLILAVIAGGILQLILVFRKLNKKGFKFNYSPRLDKSIKKVFKISLPALIGAGVFQFNSLIDTILGYWLQDSALPSLYFSQRLVYLPVGLFAVALATVCLPAMSRAAAVKDIHGLKRSLHFSLSMVLFLTIPSTLLLMVFGEELIILCFQRGDFDYQSTKATLLALVFYLPGIPAFSAMKVIMPAYHSRLDTVTPLKVSIFSMILNLILNLILMQFLQQGGLALATAISSTVNVILLIMLLRRDIGNLYLGELAVNVFKMGVSICPAILIAIIFKNIFPKDCSFFVRINLLLSIVITSGISYLYIASRLKLKEPQYLLAKLFARKRQQ